MYTISDKLQNMRTKDKSGGDEWTQFTVIRPKSSAKPSTPATYSLQVWPFTRKVADFLSVLILCERVGSPSSFSFRSASGNLYLWYPSSDGHATLRKDKRLKARGGVIRRRSHNAR